MPGGVRVGKKLKEARIRRLLTQEELAEKAGLSPGTVVKIERDQTEPHFHTIRRLAAALEVAPEDLVTVRADDV